MPTNCGSSTRYRPLRRRATARAAAGRATACACRGHLCRQFAEAHGESDGRPHRAGRGDAAGRRGCAIGTDALAAIAAGARRRAVRRRFARRGLRARLAPVRRRFRSALRAGGGRNGGGAGRRRASISPTRWAPRSGRRRGGWRASRSPDGTAPAGHWRGGIRDHLDADARPAGAARDAGAGRGLCVGHSLCGSCWSHWRRRTSRLPPIRRAAWLLGTNVALLGWRLAMRVGFTAARLWLARGAAVGAASWSAMSID